MTMELTPEQQRQIQQAKDQGERHLNLDFTVQQKSDWRRTARQEQDERAETRGQLENILKAA